MRDIFKGLDKEKAEYLVWKLSDEGVDGIAQHCYGDSPELDGLIDSFEQSSDQIRAFVDEVREHFKMDEHGQEEN